MTIDREGESRSKAWVHNPTVNQSDKETKRKQGTPKHKTTERRSVTLRSPFSFHLIPYEPRHSELSLLTLHFALRRYSTLFSSCFPSPLLSPFSLLFFFSLFLPYSTCISPFLLSSLITFFCIHPFLLFTTTCIQPTCPSHSFFHSHSALSFFLNTPIPSLCPLHPPSLSLTQHHILHRQQGVTNVRFR